MATTLQECPKDAVVTGIDAAEHDQVTKQWTDLDSITGMAELMQRIVEAMASDGDERMLEKFVQVVTKLSPSLGDSVNAIYRKLNTAVSCDEDAEEGIGRDHQDGEDCGGVRGVSEVGRTGVNCEEAPPPNQGPVRSKRVIKEDQDDTLPPGKRLSPPGDTRATGCSPGDTRATGCSPGDTRATGCSPGDTRATGCSPGDTRATGCSPGDTRATGCPPGDTRATGCSPGDTRATGSAHTVTNFHSGLTSPSNGLTSDSILSVEPHLSKELQPHAVWKLDHWSRGLICSNGDDAPDGPALSTWQLQDYQLKNGLNGEGAVVAIVDSGINPEHTAFSQKILWAQSFVPGEGVVDTLGHGTMCAGIACGAQFEGSVGAEEWIGGIAPGAKLAVCKVVPDGSVQADLAAVCEALDFIQNYNTQNSKQPVNVVSLSFGTPCFNRAICSRVHTLAGMGVIVVCAASNEGRLKTQPIAFPARLGHVLCIGSHSSNGTPSPFSAVGREIDFLAPGENVWAPSVGGPQAISCASGTSYAAPAVAGLICLVLQYLRYLSGVMDAPLYECAHSVWAMRELLKEMAASPGHHSEELGFGTLEPAKFFEKHIEEIKRIILKMIQ